MIKVLVTMLFIIFVMPVKAQTTTSVATAVAWNMDNSRIAVGFNTGLLQIVDVETSVIITELEFETSVMDAAWSPIDRDLITVAVDNPSIPTGQVIVLDIATGQHLLRLDGGESVRSVAWSPNGVQLAAGFDVIANPTASRFVRVWDAEKGDMILEFLTGSDPLTQISWSPDANYFASPGSGGSIAVWNSSTGESIKMLHENGDLVQSVAWSPDNDRIAIIINRVPAPDLLIWELADREANIIYSGPIINDVIWSPDGNYVAFSTPQNIHMIDVVSGEVVYTLETLEVQTALAFSTDGRRLAFSGLSISNNSVNTNLSSVEIIELMPAVETQTSTH